MESRCGGQHCHGSYCLFADEAVGFLREKGYEANRMEGGWEEWWIEEQPAVDEGS